jgi:hypothetical protein
LHGGEEFAKERESSFFFPLLRTDSVLRTLNNMWRSICDELDFSFVPLEPDADA